MHAHKTHELDFYSKTAIEISGTWLNFQSTLIRLTSSLLILPLNRWKCILLERDKEKKIKITFQSKLVKAASTNFLELWL